MLKKKERLTRTAFDRSFSIGKRIHSPFFQIIYSPGTSFHGSVVVPKKVYKRAVDRNKIRRQLYACIYQFHKKYPNTNTYIVIVKAGVKTATYAEIIASLLDGLTEANTK